MDYKLWLRDIEKKRKNLHRRIFKVFHARLKKNQINAGVSQKAFAFYATQLRVNILKTWYELNGDRERTKLYLFLNKQRNRSQVRLK